MQTEDLAYDLSINESQMTQEPISKAFIGICDKIALSWGFFFRFFAFCKVLDVVPCLFSHVWLSIFFNRDLLNIWFKYYLQI